MRASRWRSNGPAIHAGAPIPAVPTAPTGSFATMEAWADSVAITRGASRLASIHNSRGVMGPGQVSGFVTGTVTINAVAVPVCLQVATGPLVVNGPLLLGHTSTADSYSTVLIVDGDLIVEANGFVSTLLRTRGLFIFVRGQVYWAGTGDMHGKAAAGQAGLAIQVTTNRNLPAAGAAGAAGALASAGSAGSAGTNGQTGGGASGGGFNGGKGGDGQAGNAWSGGPGGAGNNIAGGGGSTGGNAPGANAGVGGYPGTASPGNDGFGSGNGIFYWGLGFVQTPAATGTGDAAEHYSCGGTIWVHGRGPVTIAATGVIKSNGGSGGRQTVGGGGAAAGSVNVTSDHGAPTNSGTLQANGVANVAGAATGGTGGAGTTRAVAA